MRDKVSVLIVLLVVVYGHGGTKTVTVQYVIDGIPEETSDGC